MTESLEARENRNLTWQVSQERWQQAQDWELQLWRDADRSRIASIRDMATKVMTSLGWRRNNARCRDDWNEWWADQFDQYQAIPLHIGSAIELGSGPFTNMRIICCGRSIRQIWCSDPLVHQYASFKHGWLADAYRDHKILLDDHPAEHLPFADGIFDLTVMINVLDHVRDARACLANALRITRKDGLFVFGQDLTNNTDPGLELNDVGHPIMLDHDEIDQVLLPMFNVQLRKVLPRESGRNPNAHYGTYIFIGQRAIRGESCQGSSD